MGEVKSPDRMRPEAAQPAASLYASRQKVYPKAVKGSVRTAKWLILALYIGGALVTYSQLGWVRINEIIRIPIIEYAAVFLLAGIIGLGLRVYRMLRRKEETLAEGAAA